MNNFKQMWDFEVKKGIDFVHCNRVHPLMQGRVQQLLQELKKTATSEKLCCLAVPWNFAAAATVI